MKKFRIQPEYSVIRLQRAIKTGLSSDLVVFGEYCYKRGFNIVGVGAGAWIRRNNQELGIDLFCNHFSLPVYFINSWQAPGLSHQETKSKPYSVNLSLFSSRSSLEKEQSL